MKKGFTQHQVFTKQELIKRKFSIRKLSAGFTLIELLVVIAIIGILSSVVLTSLSGAQDKARKAAVISSLQSIMHELTMCDIDGGFGRTENPIVAGDYICVTPSGTVNTPMTNHTATWPNITGIGGTYGSARNAFSTGTYSYIATVNGATITCTYSTQVCS